MWMTALILTFEHTNLQFFMPLISAFLWASKTAEAFISMPTTCKKIKIQGTQVLTTRGNLKTRFGKARIMTITIPTQCAKVSPIVPVPQHTSNSKVSGPNSAQSPASEYSFSAARVLTCNIIEYMNNYYCKINLSAEHEEHNNLMPTWKNAVGDIQKRRSLI